MRKKSYRSYIILALGLLGLFYVPKWIVEGMRTITVGITHGVSSPGGKIFVSTREKDTEKLQEEILLLKNQNNALRHRLLDEDRIFKQIAKVKEIISIDEEKASKFHLRRKQAAEVLLEKELFSLPAEVIYREPAHWNGVLWINLGEKEISVNSPVLRGENLVGLVEFVGKHKSRVRLITDSSLVPSVCVARKDRYLAKGELCGSSFEFCRSRSEVLKGVGFNYDFEDKEGPARELRSGRPINQLNQNETLSLIDVGDLLVTTGMDGIFPKDIPVAKVTKIKTLKEGAVSIDIEATLCAGNLDKLQYLFVLPPLTSEEDEG